MSIRKIILSEIEDFNWIKDISPIISFSDINIGDQLYITSITQYFLDSLNQCGNEIFYDLDDYINLPVMVKDKSPIDRSAMDCELCYDGYPYEVCDNPVSVGIKIVNKDMGRFWVSDDMVELSQAPIGILGESEDFNWIKDIGNPIPVSTLSIGDKFKIVSMSDESIKDIKDSSKQYGTANIIDKIYDKTFVISGQENFLHYDDYENIFRDLYDPSIGGKFDVWLDAWDGDFNNWISGNDMMVRLVE
jgi:hypothetical protein